MNMNLRATGASFVAQPSQHNARDIVRRVLEAMPEATSEEQFQEFCRLKADSARDQRTVDWYFWVNMRSYFTGSRGRERSDDDGRRAAQHAERVEAIKQQIVLLDLRLPNGKLLRDATFAECGKVGGWFSRLAKKGKPNQIVGKVMTEADLHRLGP